MNNDFICPKCEGYLVVGGSVILSISMQSGLRGLILLSPELGNYAKVSSPHVKIENGEMLDYHCPICHAKLAASDVHPRLVRLIMIDDKSKRHEIFFSGIVGEHCTYKISENVYEKFGESSATYDQYFKTRRI